MRIIDADNLANKVADLYSEGEEATEGDKVVNDVIDIIDNAPTIECVPVNALIGYVRTCRDELFENMKNYSQDEFAIRDNMLTNFEQIVRLASSSLRNRKNKEADNGEGCE